MSLRICAHTRLAIVLFLALVGLSNYAHAAVPGTLSYQGFLTSNAGTPTSGQVTMTFRLYTSASGGTALWTETQNVTVTAGTYTVLLGSVSTLNTVAFDQPYFLGVTVGGDTEMTPRQALSSAPYALRASIADRVLSTPVAQTTTWTATNATGVGSATCQTGQILVGGGCTCTGSRNAGSNFGVVFACEPAGQAMVGGCYDYEYSSLYADSPIEVRAICLSGIAFVSSPELKKEPAELETVLQRLRNMRQEHMESLGVSR